MTIEEKLEQKIVQAKKGREEWIRLKERCDIDSHTYIILFPEEKTQCNRYVLKYLPDFAKTKKAEKIILLSYDDEVLNADIKCENAVCESVRWSCAQAEQLMSYYTMQLFTNNLIIASPDEPNGRRGRNIIGIKGVTEEEAAAVGILGIKSKDC